MHNINTWYISIIFSKHIIFILDISEILIMSLIQTCYFDKYHCLCKLSKYAIFHLLFPYRPNYHMWYILFTNSISCIISKQGKKLYVWSPPLKKVCTIFICWMFPPFTSYIPTHHFHVKLCTHNILLNKMSEQLTYTIYSSTNFNS